jgi:hypothetical protein
MFATVDHHGSRFVRCWLETGEGDFPADIETVFAYQNLKARVIPTDDELRRLAASLGRVHWIAGDDGVASPRRPGLSPGTDQRVCSIEGIRLELRGVSLDLETKRLNSRVLASVRVPSGSSATLMVPIRPSTVAASSVCIELPVEPCHE